MRLKLLTLFLSLYSINSYSYMYQCENSDFAITIEGSGSPELNLNNLEIGPQLFDNDITVKVKEKADNSENLYNIVASITDGAGQDSFQSFVLDGYLTPLEMRTDFYFEHEGGCLDGSVYSTSKNQWVNFDGCWGESENKMKCEF